jgi:hypothetical protein
MSFILNSLEGLLNLTPAEQATVEAAEPTLAKWATMLNAQWGTIEDLLHWLFRSQAVVNRLVADGKTLGPIVQDVLTGNDNLFEAGSAMGAVNDVKAVLNANPTLLNALHVDYNKLAPLIAQIEADMQKKEMQDAVALLQVKMSAQGVKAHHLLEHIIKEHIA